jgi:isocitrate dehydrogenase
MVLSFLSAQAGHSAALRLITNCGVNMWPGGFPESFCTDHWHCGFVASSTSGVVA